MPLYQQIYTQLRDEIISGARPLGSLVPTEHEIVAHYNVSRTTAKLALNKLAEQKFVTRKRKVGTRVISRSTMQPIVANISSALEPLLAFGREMRVSVIKIASEPAGELAATLLEVELGTSLLRIDRLRWLDGVPLGFTTAYIPEEVSKTLPLTELESTPLISMMIEAGHLIGSAKQTIAAVLADQSTANFLEMHPMEPLLRITRSYRDAGASPLLLTRAFYRADRYQADVDFGAHSFVAAAMTGKA